ncbi:MAG: IclR family transcriptional regulator, acetate operon repressor [Gaiellaceae bacterium]|jgi:DNA-binding IclR family transcriptional regulator|nr:IclR family transcriptional regulator, acetate operon repressor [Gaiellaceae bacterium]
MEARSSVRNASTRRQPRVPPPSLATDAPTNDLGVTALSRGIRVLEAVVEGGPGSSIAEIAARVALPKSTVHRLLHTFVAHGYIETTGDGYYRGSSRLLALAGRIVGAINYGRLVEPVLRRLQQHTLETIHFGVLDGVQAIYVEKLEGRRAYQMTSRVGNPIPLHCSAIGKAILAFLPKHERVALINQLALVRRTRNTISSKRALEDELRQTRGRGWTVDEEENEVGIRCLGAPVFDHTGGVVGAISVSGPVFDFSPEHAESFGPRLLLAAREASEALGAPPEVVARVGSEEPSSPSPSDRPRA